MSKNPEQLVFSDDQSICIYGANEHNLQGVDLKIPRNQLVVITGISGSGKSSLAFDTIYAEGQRRYLESFSAYARQFIGNIERPDVEKIDGLSPVIAIEQKSTNKNPRSTVGTVTEIYDLLRLLYARASIAFSYKTGQKMVQFTEEQMVEAILEDYKHEKIVILAPLVRGRKGHYRELFEQVRKQAYLKIRVDGEIVDITPKMQVDRYAIHDIELVIDRLGVKPENEERIRLAVSTALKAGNGLLFIMRHSDGSIRNFSRDLMDAETGISYEEPSPNTFSFNSPYGACKKCNGLGTVHSINLDLVLPDKSKSINHAGIAPLGEYRDTGLFRQLKRMSRSMDFNLSMPVSKILEEDINVILYGNKEGTIEDEDLTDDKWYTLSKGGVFGLLKRCFRTTSSDGLRRWAEEYMVEETCPDCEGFRLRKESLHFLVHDKHIGELCAMDIMQLAGWFDGIENKLNSKQQIIAKDVLKEIRARIGFLTDVGLTYLSLDRPARSLSGGEAQRIRLAAQIGSMLSGITYILDEPSIGLHQRDNHRLIKSLKQLVAHDNSVIVVEHDKDIMLNSDYLIDIGPRAGVFGGEIVAEGLPSAFKRFDSITAQYLNGRQEIEVPKERKTGNGNWLKLFGATGHNLKNVDLALPLGCFICVSGVSGSGKSSLINETLYPILKRHFYNSKAKVLPYDNIDGLEHIDKVIEIDQTPIGRTPRSNPATYSKVFDDIRRLFADLAESKIRGYQAGRFSFNVKGGRCEECKGGGMKVIEMNFLPDVLVECEQCMGKRYNRETLEVRYKGKSISDVLNMTVNEAVGFFEPIPKIFRKLKTIQDVGLGYLTLGQSSTTISGGEAQRVKLASELSKKDTGQTVYILDEPTTGLHFEDIRVLLNVLNKLVKKGNTLIVIEHNMDVLKVADYIIDIGPEGGKNGGTIVGIGSPEELISNKHSITAKFLKEELKKS